MRRQGIFWILTAPTPNATLAGVESGGPLPEFVVWVRGQRERGHSTGYEHYQCVVAFSKKVSLSGVTGIFGVGIHAEISRSEAANDYVCKEDTRVAPPFESGAKPIQLNSKTDWDSVWTHAVAGRVESIPSRIRLVCYNSIRSIRCDYQKPVEVEKQVYVFWGPTGTGKSRRAWTEAGADAYPKCPRTKFWCGYQGEQNVVIDEFRGTIDIAQLLRWTDRYPVRVEIKGSARPLDARRIWITSNLEPYRWYPDLDPETFSALERRLIIVHMDQLPLPQINEA